MPPIKSVVGWYQHVHCKTTQASRKRVPVPKEKAAGTCTTTHVLVQPDISRG